nr:hypothetical protein [Tanacetum cinerariifolium]
VAYSSKIDILLDIDGPATIEIVNATKDKFDQDDLVKFQELLLDAEKPLYEGCPDFKKLSEIVKLLNLKGYKKIDVCINNCLLYWKDDKDLTACRTCGISRWKVDNKTYKVYENIPAKAWRAIDEKFPEITEDPRNLRLGISADGVDVNTENRHHSVWPVLTVIYNLPPWLCMKRKFIMLLVLISRYPGNDIYVFLEPLVDDLHTLFETGVNTYDASTKDNFNLRVVVLWTINDYPSLGTLCGCPYSGFKEKNVAESLVGTLLNVSGKTEDGVNARLYLAELGVKLELFAMQEEDKTTLPLTGYTLTNAEKDIFCETLYNIRVPQGYCSNFSNLEKEERLAFLQIKMREVKYRKREVTNQEYRQLQEDIRFYLQPYDHLIGDDDNGRTKGGDQGEVGAGARAELVQRLGMKLYDLYYKPKLKLYFCGAGNPDEEDDLLFSFFLFDLRI